MSTRLLCSSATSADVLVHTGNISDKNLCAGAGENLRGAETQLVMADSRIIGNVVQPLVRSVVEPSTTDVDANNTINELTASGESIFSTSSNTQLQTQLKKQQENKENGNRVACLEPGGDSIPAVSFVSPCFQSEI